MTDIVQRLRDRGGEPRLDLVDVLAAWATGVDYQQASLPVWVREAIDEAIRERYG